jgi:hypothetical protein
VEIPEPELTAPPHKDFWEVWASHFNYQQFEDDKLVEIPANELDEDTDARPPASAAPLPPRPTPGEPDIVLRLNVGRKHGKKAADIRGLLADHVHLEGRAVRGLTVGEASTRFRVAASQQAHVVAALHGFAFEDIELQIAVVEGDGVAGGTAPALSGPGDAADESDETADILAANEESGSSVAAEASAKPRKARSRSKAAAPTTEASTAEYEIEIETTDGASGSESTPLS